MTHNPYEGVRFLDDDKPVSIAKITLWGVFIFAWGVLLAALSRNFLTDSMEAYSDLMQSAGYPASIVGQFMVAAATYIPAIVAMGALALCAYDKGKALVVAAFSLVLVVHFSAFVFLHYLFYQSLAAGNAPDVLNFDFFFKFPHSWLTISSPALILFFGCSLKMLKRL